MTWTNLILLRQFATALGPTNLASLAAPVGPAVAPAVVAAAVIAVGVLQLLPHAPKRARET